MPSACHWLSLLSLSTTQTWPSEDTLLTAYQPTQLWGNFEPIHKLILLQATSTYFTSHTTGDNVSSNSSTRQVSCVTCQVSHHNYHLNHYNTNMCILVQPPSHAKTTGTTHIQPLCPQFCQNQHLWHQRRSDILEALYRPIPNEWITRLMLQLPMWKRPHQLPQWMNHEQWHFLIHTHTRTHTFGRSIFSTRF